LNIKLNKKLELLKDNTITKKDITNSLQGWFGYAMFANTYKLRKAIIKTIS
jgi:stage III sporulation protein SpoIIIAA